MGLYKTIYAEQLQIFDAEMKKKKLSFKEALINYIAQDSVDTYDTGLVINGLSQTMKDLVNTTEFEEVLAGLGEYLSKNGKDAALTLLMSDNVPYLEWGAVSSFTKVGNKILEIELETQEIYDNNGVNLPILIRYERTEDGVVKKSIYRQEGVMYEVPATRLHLPYKDIPVRIFKNNRLGKPDIPVELHPALDTINKMSDGLPSEWYHSSVQYINNMNFGSTKNGEEIQEDIEGGKKVHDVNDPDGKLNSQTMLMSNGSQTPIILWNLIEGLIDKVLMFSAQFRDMSGAGGTKNKQTLEVAGENKRAFEYMLSKIDWRQKQLTEALALFDGLLNDLVGQEPGTATVTIKIPELEQYKKDKQAAEVAKMNAETNAFNAQAEQYRASAEAALRMPEQPATKEVPDGE